MVLGTMKRQEDRERSEVSVLLSRFLLQYSDCTSLFFFSKDLFLFVLCVYVSACISVCRSLVCLGSTEARMRCWSPCSWSYRQLCAACCESWELNLGLCENKKGPPLQSPLFLSGLSKLSAILFFKTC